MQVYFVKIAQKTILSEILKCISFVMKKINISDVNNISHIAKIKLSVNEKILLIRQLNNILNNFYQISEVNLNYIRPIIYNMSTRGLSRKYSSNSMLSPLSTFHNNHEVLNDQIVIPKLK